MVELLRTYSDENASEVKDDAKNCIVSLLGRPNVLIMDFLLTLSPVAALQGEPIFQVLQCIERLLLSEMEHGCQKWSMAQSVLLEKSPPQ